MRDMNKYNVQTVRKDIFVGVRVEDRKGSFNKIPPIENLNIIS